MLSTLISVCSLSSLSTNYSIVNMPNLFNLLILIILDTALEERTKGRDIYRQHQEQDIVQMIKTNMGMTFYESFKQYVMKKYPLEHRIVRLVNERENIYRKNSNDQLIRL